MKQTTKGIGENLNFHWKIYDIDIFKKETSHASGFTFGQKGKIKDDNFEKVINFTCDEKGEMKVLFF